MRIFIVAATVWLLFASGGPAQAQVKWHIERGPSALRFTVSHFYFTEVKGQFKSFRGTVVAPSEDGFQDAQVDVTIPISSIYTANRDRDRNLQEEPFFWAAKHPEMHFHSTSFERLTDSTYTLVGDLTIRGVTKPIMLDVAYHGLQTSTDGMTHAFFTATGSLNRYDYGMKWNTAAEAGGIVIGETVNLELTVAVAAKLHDLATFE